MSDDRLGQPARLLALAAATPAAGLALLVVGDLLLTGRYDDADPAILLWVRSLTGETGVAIVLARGITAIGNDVTLWIVTLLAAGYLATARRWHDLVQLLAVTSLGGLLTTALKAIFHRARPSLVTHLVDVSSASWPSGHAMNSAFVYGTLAMIVANSAATARERFYLLGASIVLVALIGASRILLGVHWPTDVLSGWAIGGTWALLGEAGSRHLSSRAALSH